MCSVLYKNVVANIGIRVHELPQHSSFCAYDTLYDHVCITNLICFKSEAI